jgi:hypothetical protein
MFPFVAVVLALVLLWATRNHFRRGLNRYPGPFWASVTDWWRVYDVWTTRATPNHLRLHAQHGDVVRLGPNLLSFADPKAIKIIYGLSNRLVKVGGILHMRRPGRAHRTAY